VKNRVVRNILFIVGILLITVFLGAIAYDYYLMETRMFSNPLGLAFTALMSSVFFLLPGVICIGVSFHLRGK